MDLRTYFEEARGTGVLATADREGRVNVALYARPHLLEDGTIAFIMADRLTIANLRSNPHAAYLFVEDGEGYRGTRLILTRLAELDDRPRIEKLRRRKYSAADEAKVGELRLVTFRLDEQRPLLGAGPESSAPADDGSPTIFRGTF